ncbi:helix-turn-helix transcriptional regulator [Paraburkholderia humisilvae]|nr:helix-turn-helix transcriptional regulator [Paraburkholderia humisilvae]
MAARRAQTAKVEATSRPGQFKGSLQAAQLPTPDEPTATSPPAESSASRNPHDRHWQNLIARLPEPPPDSPPVIASTEFIAPPASTSPELPPAPVATKKSNRVFFREFVDAPPAEVAERIADGIYFTRAWREYRGLTLADVAELYGRDKTTIIWHESGKSVPSAPTLEKLAQIYDCPIAQFTPKPETDPASVERAKAEPHRRTVSEPRSPAGTDYPEGVLAHLHAGKSPMLAWRLYRGMNVKALADAYGSTGSNVKAMEANAWLRAKTIDKLCPIFHCKPEQLLRPVGMASSCDTVQAGAAALAEAAPAAVMKATRTSKAAADDHGAASTSAMEAAFMDAGALNGRGQREGKERDRQRNTRLERMQREMANL